MATAYKNGSIGALNKSVRAHTEGFCHSSPVVSYSLEVDGRAYDVNFDLRDFFIICAATGTNVLISGQSGTGKTEFSKAALAGMFGTNFFYLQMDPSFSIEKLVDIRFGDIKEGKQLSESVAPTRALTAPAGIIDEFNRAPSVLVNEAQGWLTNEVVGPFEGGRTFRPGVQIPSDGNYQFKVALINEGNGYTGTSQIDRASRNRFPVEVLFDAYRPSAEDFRLKIKHGNFHWDGTGDDLGSHVFLLHKAMRDVRMAQSDSINEFLTYLMFKNNCHKSPEGTKASMVDFSTADTCVGCKAAAIYANICGEAWAIESRVGDTLASLASSFAIYRSAQGVGEPALNMADLRAAAPFVLRSKLGLSDAWIQKNAGNSSLEATKTALNFIMESRLDSLRSIADVLRKELQGEALNDDDNTRLLIAVKRNPAIALDDSDLLRKAYDDLHQVGRLGGAGD